MVSPNTSIPKRNINQGSDYVDNTYFSFKLLIQMVGFALYVNTTCWSRGNIHVVYPQIICCTHIGSNKLLPLWLYHIFAFSLVKGS